MIFSVEPLEALLPGTWTLTFADQQGDNTGAGDYTFKVAGVFSANVHDAVSGRAHLHGYWKVEAARLVLRGQEMTSWCSSCLDGGTPHNWTVELEQVHEEAFSGTASIGRGVKRSVLFQRTSD